MGRAIQPQGTYIHQPGGRVTHGHVQDIAAHLPVIDVVCCQGLNGHEENIGHLRRLEVFSKHLREGGREGRHVTPSTVMVLLG